MSKTSSEVKNRYNAKAYDRITIVVPKGEKTIIEKHAKSIYPSTNSYIYQLIKNDMKGTSTDGNERTENQDHS